MIRTKTERTSAESEPISEKSHGAAVRVTLIDKRNYHLFRPTLYQVATGLLSSDEISAPLRSILSHQENIDVLLDEVTGISPKQRIRVRHEPQRVLRSHHRR
jgi:NADH dehydrogenase FAD-containing subunit